VKWLLIVVLLSPSGNPEPFTLEFDTRAQCLAASALIRDAWEPEKFFGADCVGQQDMTGVAT